MSDPVCTYVCPNSKDIFLPRPSIFSSPLCTLDSVYDWSFRSWIWIKVQHYESFILCLTFRFEPYQFFHSHQKSLEFLDCAALWKASTCFFYFVYNQINQYTLPLHLQAVIRFMQPCRLKEFSVFFSHEYQIRHTLYFN